MTTQPDARRLAALAMALLLLGLAWGSLRSDVLARSTLAGRVGSAGSMRAVVVGPGRTTPFAVRMPIDVHRFGDLVLRERAMLELRRGRSPPRGAVLDIVRARLTWPRGPETGFDERAWLARRGIRVVVKAEDAAVVGRRGGIGGVADGLRAHVEHSLATGTRGQRLALLRGFVLGDDGGVEGSLRDAFRASGLAHLTAVSGQNVVIVAGAAAALAWLVGIGRRGRHACAIGAIVGYALAVGWEPSVVRAAVAGCAVSLAWLLARTDDSWHALALGALVILVWRPASLLEPGFQLSFAAVAAILAAVPPARRLARRRHVPDLVVIPVVVPLVCAVATAPISWLTFDVVAPWGVAANVVAEPAMPIVLWLGLCAAVVEPLVPDAGVALAWLAGWAAWWIAGCARFFGGLPGAQVRSTGAVVVLGLSVAAAGGLAVAVRRAGPRGRVWIAVAMVSVALVAAVWGPSRRDRTQWTPPVGLRLTVLDVGQGDGILVETASGAVLVDQGPPEADVAEQLEALGIRSLSALLLTHPQRDHVGGAATVLRRLRVASVLTPGIPSESADERRALREARRRRVPVVVVRRGDAFSLGSVVMRVLWPPDGGTGMDDPNRRAVVLLVKIGSVDVLLTADAESDVTRHLAVGPVEVLKVAHHGSEDPGLDRQLDSLRPKVAIISVGSENDYGHPRAETLAALSEHPGLRTYRTDVHGRIVVETDGSSIRVHGDG
jgi:competence protein ComEC